MYWCSNGARRHFYARHLRPTSRAQDSRGIDHDLAIDGALVGQHAREAPSLRLEAVTSTPSTMRTPPNRAPLA